MNKILIIEDEKQIADIIRMNLELQGYGCDICHDGVGGLEAALSGGYGLILLDLMLPGLNGFEVCRGIRGKSDVPVIMVTAREEEKDRILGLDVGADDYIIKPFSVAELVARVRANIRRHRGEILPAKLSENVETYEGLTVDNERYSVTKNGAEVDISKKEFEMLWHFINNRGKIFTREELLSGVWGYSGYYGDIRTVDVAIRRLREKIEDDPAKPVYIKTKHGVGYYL